FIHCTSVPRRFVPLFFSKFVQRMSPLLAQSGHADLATECPLSGVNRTSRLTDEMSAYDLKAGEFQLMMGPTDLLEPVLQGQMRPKRKRSYCCCTRIVPAN
ncbi:MAG: hypothetical protein WBO12_02345, partial [Xanthobacteraceae bacterium]